MRRWGWHVIRSVVGGLAAAIVLALVPAAPAVAGDAPARLAWRPCAEDQLQGWDCARFDVPRDYADPSLGTLSLAVVRLRSTGTAADRIGSLFVNAGGPGLSTIDEAPARASRLPESVRRHFDFVTWDPRGVKRSSGLDDCPTASVDVPPTGPVDWASVMSQLRASQAAANRACEAKYADVLPYIGTRNTVRDLDALWAAVGDSSLTYWAPSYGSRIGYTYARMFPERVRAILVSGAVNPRGSLADFVRGLGFATDDAVRAMLRAIPGLQQQYEAVAASLEQAPVQLPSGYAYSRWDLAVSIFLAGANEGAWPQATQLVSDLADATTASGPAKAEALAALDDALHFGSIPAQGAAERFINCLDYADRPTPREQLALARRARSESPMTGAMLSAFPVECAGMTVTPDPVPTVGPGGAMPPLLIATATHDGRTPFRWTKSMATAFPGSRVISYDGGNHMVAFAVGSACIDDAAARFLVRLQMPSRGISCASTFAGLPR